MPTPPDRVLVGEGPSFLNFEAAFSSFFYGKPPGNFASQGNMWRISRLDRRGCLHRVTIGPDALVISARRTQLAGAVMELSSPAGAMTRPVGRTGKVRLRLPAGLADSSLLLLRSDDDWLDYRYFHAPVPGRQQDPSVVWDQPGAEMRILLAGGEGLHVEFKQQIPATQESRKKMLKTVAAFASGDGGTIVFGVSDDAQPVGLCSGTIDQHKLAVANMIRDSITPEPPYRLRTADMDGHVLLAARRDQCRRALVCPESGQAGVLRAARGKHRPGPHGRDHRRIQPETGRQEPSALRAGRDGLERVVQLAARLSSRITSRRTDYGMRLCELPAQCEIADYFVGWRSLAYIAVSADQPVRRGIGPAWLGIAAGSFRRWAVGLCRRQRSQRSLRASPFIRSGVLASQDDSPASFSVGEGLVSEAGIL
jgi:schlafen family protein